MGFFFTIKDQLVNSVRGIVAAYSRIMISMEVNCMGKNSQTLMLSDAVLNSKNNCWVLDCFEGSYTHVSVDVSRRSFECV